MESVGSETLDLPLSEMIPTEIKWMKTWNKDTKPDNYKGSAHDYKIHQPLHRRYFRRAGGRGYDISVRVVAVVIIKLGQSRPPGQAMALSNIITWEPSMSRKESLENTASTVTISHSIKTQWSLMTKKQIKRSKSCSLHRWWWLMSSIIWDELQNK